METYSEGVATSGFYLEAKHLLSKRHAGKHELRYNSSTEDFYVRKKRTPASKARDEKRWGIREGDEVWELGH